MNPHGRVDGPREKPLPVTDLIAERERRRLAEYREQVDRGDRTALALIHDGLGADAVVTLDAEEIGLIGLDLSEARSDLMLAAKVAGRATDKSLHMWLTRVVSELELKQAELAGGGKAA